MTGRSNHKPAERTRLNSLNLSSRKLGQILDLFERGAVRVTHKDRVASRWPFRQESVRIQIIHPGDSVVDVYMACRNLSRSGIGLLHSAFLHSATRCIVYLPHPAHGEVPVKGEVVRCLHRGGVLHEIGVCFDHEINPRSYVRPDPLQELFAFEHVEPQSLSGTVLLVEPGGLDAQLVTHFLRETDVLVRLAAEYGEALELARQGVDLIVSEHKVGESTCEEMARTLRMEKIMTPIILCSAACGKQVLSMIDGNLVQAYLRKPVTQEKLTRALGEFLSTKSMQTAGGTAHIDDELIRAVRPELVRCAKSIEKAVQRNQPMEVLAICLQLQTSVGPIGLSKLASEIENIIGFVSETMELDGVMTEIDRVIAGCRAA